MDESSPQPGLTSTFQGFLHPALPQNGRCGCSSGWECFLSPRACGIPRGPHPMGYSQHYPQGMLITVMVPSQVGSCLHLEGHNGVSLVRSY